MPTPLDASLGDELLDGLDAAIDLPRNPAPESSAPDSLIRWLHDMDRSLPSRDMIRAVYDVLDTLLLDGRVATCDAVLEGLDVSKLTGATMLAALTITLPAAFLLKQRPAFHERVMRALPAGGPHARLAEKLGR